MQLLSPSLMIAAVTAPPAMNPFQELVHRPEFQELRSFFLGALVASEFTRVLAYWIASKALVEPARATLPYALKLWVSYWIFLVVSISTIFVVAGLIGFTALQTRTAGPLILTIMGLTSIFFLFVTLFIPMNIYSIGLIRSFGFLLLAGFMGLVIMVPVNAVLLQITGGGHALATLRTAITDAQGRPDVLLKNLAVQAAPDEINRMLDEGEGVNGRKPSLAEREAMVTTIQQKLTARKAALPPGNTAAQEAFQIQLNRYLRFRDSVVNEMKSQPGAGRPQ